MENNKHKTCVCKQYDAKSNLKNLRKQEMKIEELRLTLETERQEVLGKLSF